MGRVGGRAAVAGVVLLVLVSGCTDDDRPEGFVPQSTTTTTPEEIVDVPGTAESVRGFLIDKQGSRGRSDDTPVGDVRIAVTTFAGAEVGETTSDADGEWEIAVPAAGHYRVILDEETLPDDVTPPTRPELDVSVQPGQRRIAIFDLGRRIR